MIAGITGHQEIGPTSVAEWVGQQIRALIRDKGVTCGVTSLAVGADQLFVENLLRMHIPYEVILPCNRYTETFDAAGLCRYEDFLRKAITIRILPFPKPSEGAFYAAGRSVVHRSDFMIAVWNGQPARGIGGTADIVNYSRSQRKNVAHLNPITLTVKWLTIV